MGFIVRLNDDLGGRDRKIYITSWGTSPWKIHAKEFSKEEAEKELSAYLNCNDMEITVGEVIPS